MSLRFILVTACVLFCIRLWAQAQITLKKYEDESIDGYKSIVFEYEETSASAPGQPAQVRKVQKEFDIEANNPFQSLNLNVQGKTRYGGKVYSLTAKDTRELKKRFQLKDEFPVEEGANLVTYTKVKTEKGHAFITYSTIVVSEGEQVEEMRSSEIVILDERGKEVFKLSNLLHDVTSLTVAANGKYVAFASGEYLEHSSFGVKPMVHIYKTSNGTPYHSIEGEVQGIGQIYNMIRIDMPQIGGGYKVYILDEQSGNIYQGSYKRTGNFFIAGYNRFKIQDDIQTRDDIVTFADLNRVE